MGDLRKTSVSRVWRNRPLLVLRLKGWARNRGLSQLCGIFKMFICLWTFILWAKEISVNLLSLFFVIKLLNIPHNDFKLKDAYSVIYVFIGTSKIFVLMRLLVFLNRKIQSWLMTGIGQKVQHCSQFWYKRTYYQVVLL